MKILHLLLLIFMSVVACTKKEPKQKTKPIDFVKELRISSHFATETSTLEIKIDLPAELHAYGPGEKIGKPVSLDILPKNNWKKSSETEIPQGQKKNLGILGESTVLTAPIRIRQKLLKGQGRGEAELHLQICSTTTCDRPRSHKLYIE